MGAFLFVFWSGYYAKIRYVFCYRYVPSHSFLLCILGKVNITTYVSQVQRSSGFVCLFVFVLLGLFNGNMETIFSISQSLQLHDSRTSQRWLLLFQLPVGDYNFRHNEITDSSVLCWLEFVWIHVVSNF